MGVKHSFVEVVHDEGYGDQLLDHINAALGGKDMRAVRVADGDLLGAAEQAFGALVGATPAALSAQGLAKSRLRDALGYSKRRSQS